MTWRSLTAGCCRRVLKKPRQNRHHSQQVIRQCHQRRGLQSRHSPASITGDHLHACCRKHTMLW